VKVEVPVMWATQVPSTTVPPLIFIGVVVLPTRSPCAALVVIWTGVVLAIAEILPVGKTGGLLG
jgi:hypothetical protein